MFKMTREKLQSALRELDQARYNHERWYKDLIRTITCKLPGDHRDLANDSYRQCRFGQWYYGNYDPEFLENKTYQSIELEHRKMHELAARILSSSERTESISPIDYDNFANVLDRLRINIDTLKHEIEETLYNRDPLTGARNRVSMLSELRQLMELVQRGVQQTSICLMDIDHFKAVNDTFGHQVGDKVLVHVSEYISEHIRPYDKIYRYGGEEFLISMPNTDLETARTITERLREGISSEVAAYHDNEVIRVNASFGIAELNPSILVEDAIERADKALYGSKAHGRNRVTLWDESLGVNG